MPTLATKKVIQSGTVNAIEQRIYVPDYERQLFKRYIYELTGYNPHPNQLKLHNDKHRFKVATCGRRWGKTTFASREAVIDLLEPKRVWVVGSTYDIAKKVYREVENIMINKLGLLPIVHKNNDPPMMRWSWGSEIYAKSAKDPNSLLGDGLDKVIFDEAAKERNQIVWSQYLRASLADRKGSAIFISTPSGRNWFWDLFEMGQDPKETEWFSMNAPSWDNCFVFPKGKDDPEIRDFKSIMPDAVFRQEVEAAFVTMAGRVYTEWDRDIHGDNSLRYEQGNPVFLGWDFGYRHPAVFASHIDFKTNTLSIFDEFGKENSTIDDCISWVRRHPWIGSNDLAEIVCDPAGNASDSEGMTAVKRLRNNGFNCISYPRKPEDKEIMGGVYRVKYLLKEAKIKVNIKKCPMFVSSIEGYVFDESDTNNLPVKDGKHDHFMDALRYLVVVKFRKELFGTFSIKSAGVLP